jgi:hypothetical protein
MKEPQLQASFVSNPRKKAGDTPAPEPLLARKLAGKDNE